MLREGGHSLGQAHALDPIHGQQTGRRVAGIGLGDSNALLPREVFAKPVHDSRFGVKIEFGQGIAPELRQERRQVSATQAAWHDQTCDPHSEVERIEIAAEQRLQPRSLHLDRDRLAIRQACLVHLRQGRGGDGFVLEAGKGGLQRRC